MLVTLNTALSYFGGSVLAWGIIGPILVATGAAQGMPVVSKKDPHYEKWHTRVSYTTMFVDDPTHISPRYWLMWPWVASSPQHVEMLTRLLQWCGDDDLRICRRDCSPLQDDLAWPPEYLVERRRP